MYIYIPTVYIPTVYIYLKNTFGSFASLHSAGVSYFSPLIDSPKLCFHVRVWLVCDALFRAQEAWHLSR